MCVKNKEGEKALTAKKMSKKRPPIENDKSVVKSGLAKIDSDGQHLVTDIGNPKLRFGVLEVP